MPQHENVVALNFKINDYVKICKNIAGTSLWC